MPIREEGVLRTFIALKNPSPWPGFGPATFGSSDQHTNHYTTKDITRSTVQIKVTDKPPNSTEQVLIGKLSVTQLVKKAPTNHGTLRFIIAFT
jgi:hypothetical protein